MENLVKRYIYGSGLILNPLLLLSITLLSCSTFIYVVINMNIWK